MRTALGWATFMFLGVLLAGKPHAASLEVSPVVVSLAAGQRAATIEVQNRGGASVAVQARAFNWGQAGDTDNLTPTQEIVLSPPIFTIPAGASQTVRLLLRGGAAASVERTYRLLLDEVPPANSGRRQVTVALRLSLPVIAPPASEGTAALQWRAARDASGQTILTAVNTGQGYARVSAISVTLPDGSRPAITPIGQNPYVLAGAQRRWILQGHGVAAGTPLRLSVATQQGKTEYTLTP